MTPRLLRSAAVVGVTLLLAATALFGQTVITEPKNKYSPAEDVQLGQQAAVEVEKQLPILRDGEVTPWIASVGQRLVAAIPQEFRHSEFRYSFKVVNVSEINAFALPGGPTYVNRGMITQARSQGEAVSVLAHEISHVALRHGTAQATKATKYEVGTMAGAVLGSIIGGKWGGVVAQGTEFGLGTAFLRFSREYERQADLLGSHIMAAAGYDPREMASMFQTIQKQGGSGGPEWLSGHPDPGNRSEAIAREAALLRIQNPVSDTWAFADVQARLSQMAPAPTTEEATKTSAGRAPAPVGAGTLDPGRVAAPASSTTTYTEGDVFRVKVPSNWRELPGNDAVTFAPDGAFGEVEGQGVVTHGMVIGIAGNETHDLNTATEEFVASLGAGNPSLRRDANYSRVTMGSRQWLRTTLSNRSPGTNQDERIAVFTVLLQDGTLFYALGVAPRDRFSAYEGTFRKVVGSIQFTQ
jgi:Zn-dependent protease with chaperone function